MTIIVIECVDAARLAAYHQSPKFLADFPAIQRQPDLVVVREGVHENAELDDQGTIGAVHWLLVEDDSEDDHATFRLEEDGRMRLRSTGVEV